MNSSDDSLAVVELPDDLIEANAAAQLAVMRTSPPSLNDVIATALIAAEPLIAARVRAEAVADERQRIINELAEAARAAHAADGETDADRLLEAARRIASGYPVRGSDATEAVARLLRFVAEFISAAGSVPVATPYVYCANGQHSIPVGSVCPSCGPVATPTEPAPGSDEAYRLQQQLQAENRLVATLHGRSDPCMCPDCAASPVPAEQPTEVASITLDALGDWSELAEAFGAVLVNHEVGDSGEYETGMHWPNGRSAWRNDQLVILTEANLPADLPAAEQPEER